MKPFNRVLIIDDDEINNFVTERYLIKMELAKEIEVYQFPDVALERIANLQLPSPDLILLDINMPLMSGFEWIQRCEARGIFLDKVVIVITSSIREEDKRTALSFSCVKGYMEKPFRQDSLMEIFEGFLA